MQPGCQRLSHQNPAPHPFGFAGPPHLADRLPWAMRSVPCRWHRASATASATSRPLHTSSGMMHMLAVQAKAAEERQLMNV